MSIAISSDHLQLAESVRSLTKRTVTSADLHEALDAEVKILPAYWRAAADIGLFGLHLPEQFGGQGFGYSELVVVIEELGRSAAPGPFVPTVLAAAVVELSSNSDAKDELLPPLSDGSQCAATSLRSNVVGRIENDMLHVEGTASSVVGASAADVVVLPVSLRAGETRPTWIAMDAADLTVRDVESVDLLRPIANIEIAAQVVPASRVLGVLDVARLRSIAAVLYSAEAVGVASACTHIASEYARVRHQFGRPIGQFQAVKHKCAAMLVDAERAAAAVWDAARALDDATSSHVDFSAAIAAVLAPRAALTNSQNTIQVLGGIGFTWEHDAHIYYRRAIGIAAAIGRSADWSRTVTERAIESGLPSIEVTLSDDAECRRGEIRCAVAQLAAVPANERTERIAAGGWVLPHLPVPWGRNANAVNQVIIQQEFKAAKIVRPEMALANWMVPSLIAYGTSEQQQRFLPQTLRGEVFWCQLFSEPGAGSDLASLTTKATKVVGGWRLTGTKVWNSLAQFADRGFCLARTDPTAPKHEGITYFLIDMKAAGVTVKPLRELTGSALFNEVFLEDVFVSDEDVVGEVNKGWEVTRNTLSNERVSLSNKDLPLYASCNDVVRYAQKTELDAIAQDRIGRLVAEGYTVRLLNLRSTMLQIDGTDPGASSSVAKLLNMRFGQHAAEVVHAEFGHEGASANESQTAGKWASYLLASRATTIYGGTTEIQLNIIAERQLHLPRDPVPIEL